MTVTRFGPFIVVGSPTGSPTPLDPAASIELADTNRGFVPNRMTAPQRDSISNPIEGMLIYNTDTHAYQYWTGTTWSSL